MPKHSSASLKREKREKRESISCNGVERVPPRATISTMKRQMELNGMKEQQIEAESLRDSSSDPDGRRIIPVPA